MDASAKAQTVDGRALLLYAGLFGILLLGFSAKEPCLRHAWDGFQYQAFCYTDIVPQWGGRNFNQPGLPYIDYRPPEFHAVEYPVVVGMSEWAAAQGSTNVVQFFYKNTVLIAASAFGTLALLLTMNRPHRQLVRFVAAPSIVWAGFHNWDLYPVFFTVLAFWYFERARSFGTGAALALGASAKFFPAFFAPVFVLHYLRPATRSVRDLRRFLAGFVGIGLLVNGPFMLLNWQGWWWTFDFHLQRGVTLESVWWATERYLKDAGLIPNPAEDFTGAHRAITAVLFLLLFLIPLFRAGRGQAAPLQACWEILLIFMLTSKVFSVQYELWLLAFVALLPIPWTQYLASEGVSTFAYFSIFSFFYYAEGWVDTMATASYLRHGVLIWMLVHSFRHRIMPTSAAPEGTLESRQEPGESAPALA